MPFFRYTQNNSRGVFVGPGEVIVEAADSAQADVIAGLHGVYFDGVFEGLDCACCGDRWSKASEEDRSPDMPELDEYDRRRGVLVIRLSVSRIPPEAP